jgi:hypothetical protein
MSLLEWGGKVTLWEGRRSIRIALQRRQRERKAEALRGLQILWRVKQQLEVEPGLSGTEVPRGMDPALRTTLK